MQEIGGNVIFLEGVVVILLLIASMVAILARRLRLPYTVGLVLIGLAMTMLTRIELHISPELILGSLLPPLVFEAAFHIRVEDLRRDFWLILLLAIPGVVITTLLVGEVISWGTGLALEGALVFGAMVAATDPVAVVALFRRLGAPKRLQVLLEGESLFNDGTAIVMFDLTLAVAAKQAQFSLGPTVTNFLTTAGGGVLVGIVLGLIASQIIGRIDDPLVETTLTTVLAFGSYIVADILLGVSGVLAVVAAGIVNGNVGPRGMSPTTRVVVFNFWEYAAFLANSLVFLLIGLTIDLQVLLQNWQAIVWAILAVLGARAVSIYGFSLFDRKMPSSWRHVLYWGGLRGAIALALALSLPTVGVFADERGRLQAMAFGVVLFTLLVQGFSMDWLVKKLKLVQRSQHQQEYERRHARFVAGRAAYDYIRRMSQQGLISEHTWQRLSALMERQNSILVEALKDVVTSDPTVEAEELDTARREALRAQRGALTGLLRDGVISEETYSQLVGEVDAALTEEHLTWPELLRSGSAPSLTVRRLMATVIQEQDLENAINTLSKIGFSVARLPSTGGFLSRKNVTLLIGLPEGREEAAVKALRSSCSKRVEFVSSPLADASLPLPEPTKITVGGATIFTFEVESYDEF
jgi:CPA1 family monovalent cation:H+ antiporter